MPSVGSLTYPGTASLPDDFRIGQLPRVGKAMERPTCRGRVWIFLVLGVLLIVFSLVIIGLYFNIQSITSSSEYTEIIPLYINAGAVALSGCSIAILFWRRWKLLVFVTVVVSVATGFLCGITAVLTATHIVRPIQSFMSCRYYMSQSLCQCISHYIRDMLSLEYSDTEETKYNFEGAGSCTSVQDTLPHLLYSLVVVCAIVFIVCIVASILALLVLRAERRKRGFFETDSYDDVFTVSGSSVSSNNQSDSEPEVIAEVTARSTARVLPPLPSNQGRVNSTVNKNTTSLYTNPRSGKLPSNSSHGDSINSNSALLGNSRENTLQSPSVAESLKRPVVPRSKTPNICVDNLTSGKNVNTVTADSNLHVRKQISKTPDGEIGRRRRNSLTNLKRLSRSCDSLDTTGNDDDNENCGTTQSEGKTKGKLKAHRRKGRRAVTLHNLDTKQLTLIYNLQMRYMQETKDFHSQKEVSTSANPRRAITPQPTTQKSIIPPSVRSHTPQPYKSNERHRAQQEREFYEQIALLNANYHDNSNFKNKCTKENFNDFVAKQQLEQKSAIVDKPNTNQTTPLLTEGYNPYFQQSNVNSDSNIYHVTYSDNMLNMHGPKPKSRASMQDYFLPPRPLHRHNQNNSLPPQPIRRQGSVDSSLPPEPLHRGKSAFQVVETQRGTHILAASDQNILTSTPRRKQRKDYAEVAIRDNFKMNQNPYLFRGMDSNTTSIPQDRMRDYSDGHSTGAKRNHVTEILPPYSGPPSYREFVSSYGDQSQTSSLSSNSEDLYSRPLSRNQDRRSQKADHGKAGTTEGNNENIHDVYGNIDPENLHILDNHHEMARGQRSCPEREVIYTSPMKSKVKQCIVPEDYYSQVNKCSRTNKDTPVYENAEPTMSYTVQGVDENHYDYTREYSNVAVTAGSGYSTSATGYRGQFNPTLEHQIAPDAKYHEYEDVYDTPGTDEPTHVPATFVPSLPARDNSTKIPENCENVKTKPKKTKDNSKRGSPKKSQVQSVSNVSSVRNHAHIHPSGSCVNTQVSESVENVHANLRNVPAINVPAIKVNGADEDDEVFVDENIYGNKQNTATGQSEQKTNKQILQETQTVNENLLVPTSNETAKKENSNLKLTNGSVAPHNSNLKPTNGNVEPQNSNLKSTNPVEDYMKMSLPSRGIDNYSHMVISSNKNRQKNHVTESSNEKAVQDNVRCGPDGRDSSLNSTDLTDEQLSSEEDGDITGV